MTLSWIWNWPSYEKKITEKSQSTMNVKVGQPNYMYVDIYTELCVQKSNHCVTVVSIKGKTEFLGQYTSYICITMSVSIYSHAVFYFTYGNSNIIEHCLKARCHYQSFLCQRTLWQSFWWNFDSDNGQRNLWSKTLTQKVRPLIERQDTKLREAISAVERLAVTLRFLATDFPFPAFLLPCAFVL
jgi:hypothetical protein